LAEAIGVNADAVTAILDRADRAESLPDLGGMARPDGVVIVSERFWAFAHKDGTIREGRMFRSTHWAARIPFLRGLVRLGASLSPLFRRTGATRARERWLLAAALLAPLALVLLPEPIAFAAGLTTTLALLGLLLRGRTLFLHGAEHRAIMAAEQRLLGATWVGEARPTRFAPRCGTNFAVLVFPVAFFAQHYWPIPAAFYTPLAVSAASLAFTMEIWRIVQTGPRWTRVLLLPGLALQRLTTQEPRPDETRLALTALASVLSRELQPALDVALPTAA
jgi:uncharacterized protein YqhQ